MPRGVRQIVHLLFLVTFLLPGCSGNLDPYGRLPVSGSVTLDGQPLPNGEIAFTSESVVPVVSGGKIIDGKFSVPQQQGLPPGTYKVAITSMKEIVHPSGDAMNHPTEYKELIPENFNKKSTLTAEVTAQSENKFSFDVITKK